MISVIIPSYNSETTIQKCLDSLMNQTYEGGYEIIVVDSSTDNTPNLVSSIYPHIRLVHLEKKTDPGTARNIGVGEAKGDTIAFIDADCVASPGWLEGLEQAHQGENEVVGGAVKNGNSPNDHVGFAGYIAEFREFLPKGPTRLVRHLPTCNISYKRLIFDRFGMFEGEYYPQEDLVFNYNLWKNGIRILMDPSIQIAHYHRSDIRDFLSHQKTIGRATSRALKVTKLPGFFIVTHPGLALLIIPLLPVVKFTRTVYSFLKYQPKTILTRPLALGVFVLGLFSWTVGFAQEIYSGQSTCPRK
ncbi:MAG: putative glycosyltransferase EpsJ [Syntrophorhabdus sp. PtaU1.Bin050]|nr:MAG: putative glycosyltransferase EpsJ [Syntrophorhabdus sp. PtaU1.Bin050]